MKIIASLLVFFGMLITTAAAREKEPYCTWKDGITEKRLDASDAHLFSNDIVGVEKQLLRTGAMPTGQVTKGEILLRSPYFITWYDEDLRSPLWAAHVLTKKTASITPKNGGEKRRDSFKSDTRLNSTNRATCKDFKEKIFDQGHLVPNGDLDFIDLRLSGGKKISVPMDHSFLMSNMTPQHCAFNRGVWLSLENMTRQWAEEAERTWIISGVIFDRDKNLTRDKDSNAWRMAGKLGRRVAIPSHQYKIIQRRLSSGKIESLTIILPNSDKLVPKENIKAYMADHVYSIAAIEKLTGIDFNNQGVTEVKELWPASVGRVLTARCKPNYPDL